MSNSLEDHFRPLWPFKSGWSQTISAMYFPQYDLPNVDFNHLVELPDGDKLVLCENRPQPSFSKNRIVLLIHGLTGSAFSKDSSRLGGVLLKQGYTVFRLNLRNCGPGFGLSTGIYHSGRSEDARAALNHIASIYPDLPVTQIGFSLGGNITLKLAGEDESTPTGGLDSVIAVCPPADLAASCIKLCRPENKMFDNYFVKKLRKDIVALNKKNPKFILPDLPEKLTLRDFDEYFTGPRGGFSGALDYYKKASSIKLITNIQIPTLILWAKDDPVVDLRPVESLQLNKNQKLVATEFGGHCGYLGYGGGSKGLRWMDHIVSKWMSELGTSRVKTSV